MSFVFENDTYDLQGALCYLPLEESGHYTAVCVRNRELVLFNDSIVTTKQSEVTKWFQRCRVVVYTSLLSAFVFKFKLIFSCRTETILGCGTHSDVVTDSG